MDNLAPVVEIGLLLLAGPRWGTVSGENADATRTEHQQVQRKRYPQRRDRLMYKDESSGTMLDDLGSGEREELITDDIDHQKCLSRLAESFLDEIESSLQEDHEEGLLHGEVCSTESAIATCKRIASQVAPCVIPPSGLKWAAFGEDGGGVVLVLRSPKTDRRVDFRISADGRHVSVISIDEHMTAKSIPVSAEDSNVLREKAAWVKTLA